MAANIENWIRCFAHDFGFLPIETGAPTDAAPGTADKVEVMRARIESGQAVHSPGDATLLEHSNNRNLPEAGHSKWVGNSMKGMECSKDGRYLYRVRRIWKPELPTVCVVGLHPPRRSQKGRLRLIRNQVERWGCGGIEFVNLFALRCDDADEIDVHDDPIGPVNNRAIQLAVHGATYVVLGWGPWGMTMGRSASVTWAISQVKSRTRMYCLGLTRLVPSALDDDRLHPQPIDYVDAIRPWTPRLLPAHLLEREFIPRNVPGYQVNSA